MPLFLLLSFDTTGVSASKLIMINFPGSQVKHMAIKRKGQIVHRKGIVSAL